MINPPRNFRTLSRRELAFHLVTDAVLFGAGWAVFIFAYGSDHVSRLAFGALAVIASAIAGPAVENVTHLLGRGLDEDEELGMSRDALDVRGYWGEAVVESVVDVHTVPEGIEALSRDLVEARNYAVRYRRQTGTYAGVMYLAPEEPSWLSRGVTYSDHDGWVGSAARLDFEEGSRGRHAD